MSHSHDSAVRRGAHSFQFTLPPRERPLVFDGPPRPGSEVQFHAVLDGSDSYANVAGIIARELIGRFSSVSVWNYHGGRIEDPTLAPHQGLTPSATVGLFHGFPVHAPEAFFRHPIRIGLFVCEADRILPEWVRACNRFDLIVVPSRFCREAFLRSGVAVPIMIIPHGVLPEHRPGLDRRPTDRFVFYNTFRTRVAERKGYRELMRCFQLAFQGRSDVELRLRVGDPRWLPACEGWPEFGGLVRFDPPGSLSLSGAAEIYSQVHCTVHPSKGEGFGLVPLESIACGTPVIAPAHSGLGEYVDATNANVLRSGDLIRAPRAQHQCGRFFGVDEEHLIELLRSAPETWSDDHGRVHQAGEQVRSRFAWSRVLQPMLDLVERALEGGSREAFARRVAEHLCPQEVEAHARGAGRRARRKRKLPVAEPDAPRFRFSSVVYSGWDYPPDGVGNHLRLLDQLVFNGPEIQYTSLEERPGPYFPDPGDVPESFVHEQRPDLFRDGLYLDVIGFCGDEKAMEAQIDRVRAAKACYAARSAIYLMWESDRLWPPLLDLVRSYDLVIVTCELLGDYFRRHDVRYVVLPHPYRYVIEPPVPASAKTPDPGAVLTVGVSAGLWPRKNLSLIAEVFAEVLGDDPTVRLRVHSRTAGADALMRQERARIDAAIRGCTNAELRVESLSREAYLDWMRSLDVYCFVSSGEAWSVTPREALHLGKPTVLLDAHAHAGFSHLPGVIPVAPGRPQPARAGARYVKGDIGSEATVDIDALRSTFADLRRRQRAACVDLLNRFDEVVAHHRPERVRAGWVRALNQMFDETP